MASRQIAFVALLTTLTLFENAVAAPVSVANHTPFSEDADIQDKVRQECTRLNTQLPTFIQEFGKTSGVEVVLVDSIDTSAEGRVLKLELVEAVSMGNAFWGHQKYAKVNGTLFENGTRIADFRGRRNSMGGLAAGYKGSCSVLGRTVKALGKDIAAWLKSPQDGARLGDLQ